MSIYHTDECMKLPEGECICAPKLTVVPDGIKLPEVEEITSGRLHSVGLEREVIGMGRIESFSFADPREVSATVKVTDPEVIRILSGGTMRGFSVDADAAKAAGYNVIAMDNIEVDPVYEGLFKHPGTLLGNEAAFDRFRRQAKSDRRTILALTVLGCLGWACAAARGIWGF